MKSWDFCVVARQKFVWKLTCNHQEEQSFWRESRFYGNRLKVAEILPKMPITTHEWHLLHSLSLILSLRVLASDSSYNEAWLWMFRKKTQVINQWVICSKYLIVAYKFSLVYITVCLVCCVARSQHCRWISSLNPNSLRGKQLRWRHSVGSLQLSKHECSVWKRKRRKNESFTGTI